jgi:hypothetical protein
MSNAQYYNKTRRIVFSLYHKKGKGYTAALNYLQSQKRKLNPSSFIGLMAELKFYHAYRREFELTVAADVGDKCDFAANIDQEAFRIDVTTNFDYKRYDEYEPFVKDGTKYQIALIDRENFELHELIDINFPNCEECGEGRLFDLAFLGDENITMAGNRSWNYDQIHFQYCNICLSVYEISKITTVQLPDLETLQGQISKYAESQTGYEKDEYKSVFEEEYNLQLKGIKSYLKNQFERIPFGFYSNSYTIIEPKNAEGYFETKLYWQENFLTGHIPIKFGNVIFE